MAGNILGIPALQFIIYAAVFVYGVYLFKNRKKDAGKIAMGIGGVLLILTLPQVGIIGTMGGQSQTLSVQPTSQGTQINSGGQAINVNVQTSANTVDTNPHQGTITFTYSSSTGGTAATSQAVLLKTSEGVFNGGVFDKQASRYKIMKNIQDNSITSLKYYGTTITKSLSSGAWAFTIDGKENDQFLLYTFADATPATQDNASTVNLITLKKFQQGDSTWSFDASEGTSLKLTSYGRINASDSASGGNIFGNYTYSDGGTAASNKAITWYINSTVDGEECIDCSIFLFAPTNYTGYFRSLTITAAGLKEGHDGKPTSVKYTNMWDASAQPVVGITSQVITTTSDASYDLYYIGDIPDWFDTRRTSSNVNAVTFTLYTDTYGGKIPTKYYVIQNAHALGRNNGAFLPTGFTNGFEVLFTGAASTGATGFAGN